MIQGSCDTRSGSHLDPCVVMEYNRGQRKASRRIQSFWEDPDELRFFLLGYPGTGKTMLISDIIRELLQDEEMVVMVCAPTHKALGVIRSHVARSVGGDLKGKLKFSTLHSFFGMSPVISCEDGKRVFAPQGDKEAKKKAKMKDAPNLIVIDECSMIAESMTAVISQFQETNKVKAIFMGDQDQINPVREKISVVFRWAEEYSYYARHLTEIMRTDVPEIKAAAAMVRDWDHKDSAPLFMQLAQLNKGADTMVYRAYNKGSTSQKSRWFRRVCSMIDRGETPIIIAWRNNTCAAHNLLIRQYLHGVSQPDPFLPGDLIVFNNQYEQATSTDPEAPVLEDVPEPDVDPASKFLTSDMARIVSNKVKIESLGADWTSIDTSGNTKARRALANLVRALIKSEAEYEIAHLRVIPVVSSGIAVPPQEDPTSYLIRAIYPASIADYQQRCYEVQKLINQFWSHHHSKSLTESLWNIYYARYVDAIADVCYGYSITAHKSQGSTFLRVVVDAQDIDANQNMSEMRSILLTAISRPSESLIVLL